MPDCFVEGIHKKIFFFWSSKTLLIKILSALQQDVLRTFRGFNFQRYCLRSTETVESMQLPQPLTGHSYAYDICLLLVIPMPKYLLFQPLHT